MKKTGPDIETPCVFRGKWNGERYSPPSGLGRHGGAGSGVEHRPKTETILMHFMSKKLFLQAGCPSCHTTNSVETLKANRVVGCWRGYLSGS